MRPNSSSALGDDMQQQQAFKPQERYRLLQEIGKGNFGCVYKGVDVLSKYLTLHPPPFHASAASL